MDMASLKTSLKSRTTMIVVGALAVGAVGSKTLWSDSSPAFKPSMAAAASTPKPAANSAAAPRATSAVVAGTPARPQTARPNAPKQNNTAAAIAQQEADAQAVQQPAPQRPQRVQPQQQVAVEEDEAPITASRQARMAVAGSKRTQPTEVDGSSDTEGLFGIAALKQSPAEAAVAPVNTTNASANVNTVATIGDVTNSALAERVVTSATPTAPGAVTDGLGPVFVDDTNGYYMRFPAAWSIRRFDGEPWVVECGDGKSALISVGFSAFPAEYTADDISLDWVSRRIKKRSDTVLNAQGFATIMNKKAIWSKSTGPMQVSGNNVKVVRTTYILPLGDGRVAEIRIAASPEQFEKISGVMKNAVSTFRMVPKRGPETSVARTE
jgi:hypothetical protein